MTMPDVGVNGLTSTEAHQRPAESGPNAVAEDGRRQRHGRGQDPNDDTGACGMPTAMAPRIIAQQNLGHLSAVEADALTQSAVLASSRRTTQQQPSVQPGG